MTLELYSYIIICNFCKDRFFWEKHQFFP